VRLRTGIARWAAWPRRGGPSGRLNSGSELVAEDPPFKTQPPRLPPNSALILPSRPTHAMDQPSPFTMAYLSTLPLLLSSYPSLSASASHARAKLRPLASTAASASPALVASTSKARLTERAAMQCGACAAELVGGLTGAAGVVGRVWVVRCAGCGATTGRAVEAETGEGIGSRGRHRFGRVKKRQVRARVEGSKGVNSQPAQPTLASTGAAVHPLSSTKPAARHPKLSTVPSRLTPPTHQRPTSHPTHPPAHPSPSAPQSPAQTCHASYPAAPAPTLTPTASSARAPLNHKAAAPLDKTDLRGKKKKRSTKPAGLAELLAAKKAATSGAGAKLGLQDFLLGI